MIITCLKPITYKHASSQNIRADFKIIITSTHFDFKGNNSNAVTPRVSPIPPSNNYSTAVTHSTTYLLHQSIPIANKYASNQYLRYWSLFIFERMNITRHGTLGILGELASDVTHASKHNKGS